MKQRVENAVQTSHPYIITRADRNPGVRKWWIFVQLIFGPCWSMNQLNKNPNIAKLETYNQLIITNLVFCALVGTIEVNDDYY